MRKLEMIGIRKEFPNVVANDDIHFQVESGEIIGLLGENGAGKSTLMNILNGLYQPDSGEIKINGASVHIRSPLDSLRLGIGMVHQHFMLVPNHTVAENIVLALPDAPLFSPQKMAAERLSEFSDKYGLTVHPDALIRELSAGEQQRVEILKALLSGAGLLILDEPTSVLTPTEADDLFAVMKRLAEDGSSIVFITHKLDEIMKTTSRITVLRRGKIAGSALTRETTRQELARMMVGRDVSTQFERTPREQGRVILTVENLTVENSLKQRAVKNLSFQVRAGEILGIAGVSGNGQRELIEALTGLRPVLSGKIEVGETDITNTDPRTAALTGMAHIPEERLRVGMVAEFSLQENAILKNYHTFPYSRWGCLNPQSSREFSNKIVEEYSVIPKDINVPVKHLSGGNVQKFLIGRELANGPCLVIAAHPTYGVDIGAGEFIRTQLIGRRNAGGAILLVSEDLEEILALSDRVAVIFEGRFIGIMPVAEARLEDIGLMMAGSGRKGDSAS